MELHTTQHVHVTVGQGLGSEDGGEQLPVVADSDSCLTTSLWQVAQSVQSAKM